MKKYNRIIILTVFLYGAAVLGMFQAVRSEKKDAGQLYRVEMNRIQNGFVKAGTFTEPVLHEYDFIKKVSYLDAENSTSEEVRDFYEGTYGLKKEIWPLYVERAGEELLAGYVRYDYTENVKYDSILKTAQLGLFFLFFFVMTVLVYLKYKVLIPFQKLEEMPYELAKGHLKKSIPEAQERYFGKFVWGINMLKDSLDMHRRKEIRLEREKKMLLLSISHDIKTPLGVIKLYAKALKENLYDEEKKREEAAERIEEKADEIERFVGEIVRSSTEDIIQMEVREGEFYLSELIQMVEVQYREICEMRHLAFSIGNYENRLLKGDIDRAAEVCENLMENALKYGDGRKIEITFNEEDYCQLIHVYNTGEAVEMQEMIHLFDSFYRGKNGKGREGSGLGLYISHELMKKMDGDIYAQRKKDGMEFVMVFR